jgi:hypothetical protein
MQATHCKREVHRILQEVLTAHPISSSCVGTLLMRLKALLTLIGFLSTSRHSLVELGQGTSFVLMCCMLRFA